MIVDERKDLSAHFMQHIPDLLGKVSRCCMKL